MMAVASIDVLQKNLELAREQLKNVDSNIKKITGRDPTDDRDSVTEDDNDKQKVPDDDLQVSVASSVVPVSEVRSRLDASKGMRKSEKDRGRRMLGILQGTLNQFRAESVAAKVKPIMTKRREIDAKLEARADKEKEHMRRERVNLFRSRREQQLEVNLLQKKMKLVKGPKIHNEESRDRILQTEKTIQGMIDRRQRKLDLGFEEAAAMRSRLAERNNSFEADNVDDANDSRPTEMDDWSVKQDRNSAQSTAMDGESTLQSKSRLRLASAGAMDNGDLSDASETFAIGDEEPQLMDEDHETTTDDRFHVERNIVKSKDGLLADTNAYSEPCETDTRTVRVDRSIDFHV